MLLIHGTGGVWFSRLMFVLLAMMATVGVNHVWAEPPGALSVPDVRKEWFSYNDPDFRKGSIHPDRTVTIPRELELFGDDVKLKRMCIRFSGLTLGLPGGKNKDEWNQENPAFLEWLKQRFDHFFVYEPDKGPQDPCRFDSSRVSHAESVFVQSGGLNVGKDRLVLRYSNHGDAWVSMYTIKRFVQCLTARYRREGTHHEQAVRKIEPGIEDWTGEAYKGCYNEYKSGAFFWSDDINHFLSRAYLRVQTLCGRAITLGDKDTIKEQLKGKSICMTPELVRVELVEGRIKGVSVKMEDPKNLMGSIWDKLGQNKRLNQQETVYCSGLSSDQDKPFSRYLCNITEPITKGKGEHLTEHGLHRAMMMMQHIPGVDDLKIILEPVIDNNIDNNYVNSYEGYIDNGMVDYAINTSFKRHSGMIGLDTYGNDITGPRYIWNRMDFNYTFLPGDALVWTYVKVPDGKEMNYYQFDYKAPLLTPDYYARLGVAWNSARLGGKLDPLDINEQKMQYEVAVGGYPYVGRYWKASLDGGFQHSQSETDMLGKPLTKEQVGKLFARLHVAENRSIKDEGWTINADHSLLNVIPGKSNSEVELLFSQGFSWFGNTPEQDLHSPRPDAGPNFAKVNVNIKFNRQFQRWARGEDKESPCKVNDVENGWMRWPNCLSWVPWFDDTNRFFLNSRFSGQWSADPLYSSEEISFGGRQFGKAFSQGEIAGDRGVGFELELGFTLLRDFEWRTDPFSPHSNNAEFRAHRYDLSTFVLLDGAQVWNVDATDRSRNLFSRRLSSFGGGVRLMFSPVVAKEIPLISLVKQYSGELIWARPMVSTPMDNLDRRPEIRGQLVLKFELPDL
ncbi:MAG: ShlB/FhaC/HecB family hemolysin secretion/activation protein [Magnetococcales bacterium]|nr:ShlB/FhaC/HecB family hemolysin secretion/activation protein [Magnetococcales bacterium]